MKDGVVVIRTWTYDNFQPAVDSQDSVVPSAYRLRVKMGSHADWRKRRVLSRVDAEDVPHRIYL